MPVRSETIPGGVEAMLRSPYMIGQMRIRAKRVKERAVAISNVGNRAYTLHRGGKVEVHPGWYKKSWHYRSGLKNGYAYARVTNLSPYSGFLEFGTRNMRAYRVLGRAIASVRR